MGGEQRPFEQEKFLQEMAQMIDLANEHAGEDWTQANVRQLLGDYPPEYLYQPSAALLQRMQEYEEWCNGQRPQENEGHLMEELAILAFTSLRGYDSVKSFQSFAAQIDLSIEGEGLEWKSIIEHLGQAWTHRMVVIEAKNHSKEIDDNTFSRLCHIMENYFHDLSNIGVFFTRCGATGFPKRNTKSKRSLENAQATQVVFHARTSKYVIVFDHEDILALRQPGALINLLRAKIRAVGEWTGLPVTIEDGQGQTEEIVLPKHLAQHIPD